MNSKTIFYKFCEILENILCWKVLPVFYLTQALNLMAIFICILLSLKNSNNELKFGHKFLRPSNIDPWIDVYQGLSILTGNMKVTNLGCSILDPASGIQGLGPSILDQES